MAQQIDQLTINNCQLSIQIKGLSKRFNREWIFKNFDYTFESGKTYAITGPNGSGKSTLLQILWGQLPQTAGTITYQSSNQIIPQENVFNHVSIATPYLDLIEEFTLEEQIRFHFSMRLMQPEISLDSFLDMLYLTQWRQKSISNFSSGMKQRLKLGLAFYTQADVLFLDEPGTNLDDQAFQWYLENLYKLPQQKLIFIASNQRSEYPENAEIVDLRKFK